MVASVREAQRKSPAETHFRWLRKRGWDLLWIPSLIIAAILVAGYAVDIPTIDQWDGELPFLRKAFSGQARFSDLIEPLCEHRLMLTRVLGLGVAWGAKWNPRVALCNTLLCGAALVFCLSLLTRRTCTPSAWRIAIPNLLGGALVLGIPQYDTWLNPMHVSWYIIEFLLVVSLLVAHSSLAIEWKVPICIVLATTATFSCANGLLLWFVVLPVVLVHEPGPWKGPRGKAVAICVLAWIVAASLAISRYFWDWHKPEETPPLAADGNILLFVRFFFANVGCPFAHGTAVEPILMATLCGVVITVVSLLCGCCVLFHRGNPHLVRAASSWLAIVGFGMATGLAIALGRSGFGMETAIVVRSIHVHVLTIFALLVLVPMMLDVVVKPSTGRGDHVMENARPPTGALTSRILSKQGAIIVNAVLCTLVATFHVLYCVYSLEKYENERSRYLAAKTAVLFSRSFMDGQLLGNVWSFKTMRDIEASLDFMDARGFLRPKTFKTARVSDVMASPSGAMANCGAIDQASRPSPDTVALGGWAILPGSLQSADSVLISWEAEGVEPTVFAIAPVGGPRPDIVEKLGSSRCRRSGWGRVLPKDAMPKQSAKLRAWAFNATEGQAYPLDGTLDWVPN